MAAMLAAATDTGCSPAGARSSRKSPSSSEAISSRAPGKRSPSRWQKRRTPTRATASRMIGSASIASSLSSAASTAPSISRVTGLPPRSAPSCVVMIRPPSDLSARRARPDCWRTAYARRKVASPLTLIPQRDRRP